MPRPDSSWRRKRVRITRDPPLPVPVASISSGLPSRQSWYCYTGNLQGSTVIVRHSGDMDFLYRMGFFGKGTLSRSEPNFESRRPKVNIRLPKETTSTEVAADIVGTSTRSIEVAVITKRCYLRHLQYKALEDDDESVYNELLEQETMQRYKNEEEEENELEEEDEESYESDNSDHIRFPTGQSALDDGLHVSQQSGEYKSILVSLLSQVAQLSKERIATFIKVPQTMHQLETRFQKMRYRQVMSLGKGESLSISKSSTDGHRSGSQDVIDLRELDESQDQQDVVILHSDDNGKDSEDESRDGKLSKEKADEVVNAWDDPNNKGDASFWGMDTSGNKNTVENQTTPGMKSGQSVVSDTNSTTGANGQELKLDESKEMKKSTDQTESEIKRGSGDAESHKTEDAQNKNVIMEKKQSTAGSLGDLKDSGCPENTVEKADMSQGKRDRENSDRKEESGEDQQNSGESFVINSNKSMEPSSSKISVLEIKENFSSCPSNVKTLPALSASKSEDSDDSDDVICVEDESAEPAKLHNFLSQVPKQAMPFSLVSKMVRFMTNISNEPKFVNAKVGFRSWDNILHFNYSGDASHLPTSLEVLQDEQQPNPGDSQMEIGNVYERIYPPVHLLLADPDSKGVIIKQRLEEVPCLDIARRNVLGSTSKMSHHSSHNTSHMKFSPHKQSQRKILSGPLSNKAFHSRSNLLESEREEASSLTASHFAQYVAIFHREKPHSSESGDASSSSKDVIADDSLGIIHKELDKLKGFSGDSNLSEVGEKMIANKDSDMLRFNQLLSGYLYKLGISLIKELVLLKMLVCGSEISCQIPKDVIAMAKASLSSEEISNFFDRLDFVQSFLTSKQTPHLKSTSSEEKGKSEDVIMIDLSEDESSDKGDMNDLKTRSAPSTKFPSSDDQNKKSESSEESYPRSMKSSTKSIDAEDKLTLEDGNVVPGRKRSLTEREELGTDSKMAKLDALHSEEKNDMSADDKEVIPCNGSHNAENLFSTTKLSVETGVNGSEKGANDIKCKDTESDGSSNIPKDNSAEGSNEMSSVSGELSNTANGVSNQNSGVEGKMESSSGAINVFGGNPESSSLNNEKAGAMLSADEVNQVYVVSSDEEEKSPLKGKPVQPRFSNSQPYFQTREHPYSVKDELKGDLFVVPNTSDEDEDEEENSIACKFTWQPCVKKDPYSSTERLHLLLEEAFFLTFGLGCLSVLDPEKKAMTISEMWQQFPLLKDNFIPHYVAYHYFRSKGWVPKSGLKFGCDFVLYRDGPPFYHARFSVVVVAVREGSLTPMIGDDGENGFDYPQRLNSWITMAGLNRVTEHVAKELMFCYVICPKDLTEEESKSPKCLSRFRVKEVVVSRWVSSRERENKEKEEIP